MTLITAQGYCLKISLLHGQEGFSDLFLFVALGTQILKQNSLLYIFPWEFLHEYLCIPRLLAVLVSKYSNLSILIKEWSDHGL